MARRLGLTMRVQTAPEYRETRDAISQEWSKLLSNCLNSTIWLSIPNLGNGVRDYLKNWRIDAVILTGGNGVGTSLLRDKTESLILDYCGERRLPVLGVCRGLQMIQSYYGGGLSPTPPNHALGGNHSVEVCHQKGKQLIEKNRVKVNSYHDECVPVDELSSELDCWLVSDDGLVEGLFHRNRPQIAVQWHPERHLEDQWIARRLIQSFLRE